MIVGWIPIKLSDRCISMYMDVCEVVEWWLRIRGCAGAGGVWGRSGVLCVCAVWADRPRVSVVHIYMLYDRGWYQPVNESIILLTVPTWYCRNPTYRGTGEL